MANKPTLDEMRLALSKRPKRMAEKVDLTRLYRGGYNPEPYEAQDIGAYGGLFASGTPEPASSHGPHLHYTDIPTNKILTHYALNYEVPHEKVKQALIKFAPHVKEDKELFDKLHDVVVNDKGQDLRNLDDDEIFNLLRKEPGADADNEAQRLRGQIAKHLGYHAVELEDEHGLSYLTTHGVKFKPYVTKSKGGEVLPHHQREANKAKFLEPSKVKKRLYHGTTKDIKEFKPSRIGALGPGVYLSEHPSEASGYAGITNREGEINPNVMPLHVQATNPFVISHVNKSHDELFKHFDPEGKLSDDEVIKRVIAAGHDAIYAKGSGEINMLDPRKIKSAIGNRGTYDTTNPDINKAKGGVVSILRKHGRPVDSDLDAMRKMSNGHRVFIAHEQDEKPREITSVSEMHGYTPDQIYTVDPQHFAQHKAKGGSVPSEPGSTPIKEGHVRLYHQTDGDNLREIEKHGLLLKHAKGIEGPRAIYAGETPFYGDATKKPTLEFQVPKEHWDAPFVLRDVHPQDFISAHYPWHRHARYLEDESGIKNVLSGKFDTLKGDEGKAVEYIKNKYSTKKAKGGNVMPKYPSIEEMLQKLQESGRTPIMPAPDRWFKKPEQHPFQQKAIEKLLAYTGHNREAFPHGAHINPVTGEPLDFEIMHDLGVAIDPMTGTPRMSGIKSGLTEIDPKLGSLTKSNLIRKGLFKHEGGDPLLDRIKFLATIEKSGKGHHYGLSTHYESPAELVQEMRGNPTLRPHSRGDIYGVGDEVGRISIKGMHHPVFEKLVVAPSGMNVQGKKLHKANGGKVTHAHHLEIEERPL